MTPSPCPATAGRGKPADAWQYPRISGVRSLPPASADNLESSPLINDPRSAGAESFRSLRTAIQVASQSGRLRSLLVTSPLFGEGKSTVAYNTAVAFALSGKRVLLLDADMRKPICTTLRSALLAWAQRRARRQGNSRIVHLSPPHCADPVPAARRLGDQRFRRAA